MMQIGGMRWNAVATFVSVRMTTQEALSVQSHDLELNP